MRLPMILWNAEGASAAAGAGGDGAAAAAAGGGASAAAWYDTAEGLEADDRSFLAGKGFADLKTAVSAHRQADQLARDRNVLPKPDPTKLADWPGWSDLGWKQDAADYGKGIKRPKTPDGFQYDESFEQTMVKLAHEHRVPVGAAQAMLDGIVKYAVDTIAAIDNSGAAQLTELDKALKTEWGDQYAAKKELGQRAARHLGFGMDDMAELEKVGGSPRLMKMFAQIGEMLGEDTLVDPRSGNGAGAMSASQVQAELDRQAADPEFMKAFTDHTHPRHREVRGQRDALISKQAKLAGG